MPKCAASIQTKIKSYVNEYPKEFSVNSDFLFCSLCAVNVNASKRYFVDSHRASSKHQLKLKTKSASQPTIAEAIHSVSKKADFYDDVTKAFLSADIPLEKLNNPQLRSLFENMKTPLPSESAARSRVEKISDECIEHVKEKLKGVDVFIVVDESEIRDVSFVNILVGRIDDPQTTYLIMTKDLEHAPNKNIICQVVEDALHLMEVPRERFLLLISDAAPYMHAAKNVLVSFYPNMFHITCAAHLLHNCVLRVKSFFVAVDELIARVQACIVKNRKRRQALKNAVQLPPSVVVTRWASWLKAALYYAENLPKVRDVINSFSGEGILTQRAKDACNSAALPQELLAIKRDYENFTKLIVTMQDSTYSIEQASHDFDNLASSGGLGKDSANIRVYLKERLKRVGWQKIMEMKNADLSPSQYVHLRNCQATSSSIERSFSIMKNILRDNRPFKKENVFKYVAACYNSKLFHK